MFEIEAFLLKHEIQPYINRVKIFEFIMNNDHPSVDEIYKGVKKINSRLSKMTVYNTLAVFLKAKIVREVTLNEKEAKYDIRVADHGHFKCTQCGEIFDFNVEMDSINHDLPFDCSVEKKDLFFYGICGKCLEKRKKKVQTDTKMPRS